MRVLIVTEDDYQGGIDTFITTLINDWPAPDDLFTLVVNEDYPGISVIGQKLCRPCAIRTQRWWSHGRLEKALRRAPVLVRAARKLSSPVAKYLFIPFHLLAVRRLLRATGADRLIVVNGGYPGSDVCRSAVIAWRLFSRKPKAVLSIHNMALPARWFESIQERVVDWLVGRSAGAVVAVSHACARALPTLRRLVANGRAPVVIYNGVSDLAGTASTPRPTVLERLELPSDAKVCLTLATYEPRKGHAFLVEAFELISEGCPEAHLVLCGCGTENEVRVVRSLIDRSPARARIRLRGFEIDIGPLLSAADVLLVPSQEYESFGLVCVEAFRAGVPVVATDVGGLPEVVGDAGSVVTRRDVQGFARAALRLLTDAGCRKEAGARGFSRYRASFTASRMARGYWSLLQSPSTPGAG